MTKQDYESLEKALREMEREYPAHRRICKEKGLSDQRFCWDLLNASNWLIKNTHVHHYLNDSHIETALKNILL